MGCFIHIMVRSFVEDRFETEETYKYGAELCWLVCRRSLSAYAYAEKMDFCVERKQHEE